MSNIVLPMTSGLNILVESPRDFCHRCMVQALLNRGEGVFSKSCWPTNPLVNLPTPLYIV